MLLEARNPHSFAIPANAGTEEVLFVHGQRFVTGDSHELETDASHGTDNPEKGGVERRYFYITYEGSEDQPVYTTKVAVGLVSFEHTGLEEGFREGIQVWKVMENRNVTR